MTHKYAVLGMRRVAGVVASVTLTVTSVAMGGRIGVAGVLSQSTPMECTVTGLPLKFSSRKAEWEVKVGKSELKRMDGDRSGGAAGVGA